MGSFQSSFDRGFRNGFLVCGVIMISLCLSSQTYAQEIVTGCGTLKLATEGCLKFIPEDGSYFEGLLLEDYGDFGVDDYVYISGIFKGCIHFCTASGCLLDNVIGICPDCGNGLVELTEGCDDGDIIDGDGCSSTCTIEYGYRCEGEPSTCTYFIPTVSEWGLMVMVILMMIAGTICLRRRTQHFTLFCIFFVIPTMTFAQPNLDAPHHPQQLLVRFKQNVNAQQKRNIHAANGATTQRQFRYVDGLVLIKVPAARLATALDAYQKNPNVLYAELDYEIQLHAIPDDTDFVEQWGMRNTGQTINTDPVDPGTQYADIQATAAWDIWTGDSEFKIAVIDTGVDYNHPDLANNIWVNPGEIPGNGIDDDNNGYVDDIHGYDFADNDSNPMDEIYHGTHIAGIIGAEGDNYLGVTGVNWQCKIVALKIFGVSSGFVSAALEAFEYVLDNDIHLSNNSWGTGVLYQSMYDTMQAGASLGHLFVTSAGNCDPPPCLIPCIDIDITPQRPASFDLPNIITVAATDNDDNMACFSKFGLISVDLGAPGDSVYSTVLNDLYDYKLGTSFAAPHVTGVAALVMSKYPNWGWATVKSRILNTVREIDALDPAGPTPTVTGGVVNAYGALEEDCNSNQVYDPDDITAGTSNDCNSNNVPDECENDCNNTGVPDDCDISSGTSLDCNSNGLPDVCDITGLQSDDCNSNLIPDECEIIGPKGGCCTPFGQPQCIDPVTECYCDWIGGTFLGALSSCVEIHYGACCFGSTCKMRSHCSCLSQGGNYQGDGSRCRSGPVPSCSQYFTGP